MPDMPDANSMHPGINSFNLKGCIITNIITICCIVFAFTVLIPLCIFFVCPLFKKRRDIILQKRHINLSLLASILLIIQIISENLNALFDFDVIYEMKHGQITVRFVRFIIVSIYCFAVSGFIAITFVRFFLVYFDIKYNVLMANNEWKSIINRNYNYKNRDKNADQKTKTDSFFIKYKSTLGSEKWWTRFIIIDLFLALIISPFLAWFKLDDLLFIHNGFFYILFIVIYFKLRQVKFWDDFFIVQELRKLGIAVIFLVCIWGSLRIGTEILKHMNSNNMQFKHELWMTSYLYLVYALSMFYDIYVVYITTFWVLKKLRNDPVLQIHYRNKSSVVTMQLPTPTLSLTMTKSNSFNPLRKNSKRKMTDDDKPKPIHLKHILKKSEYLEVFINHLSHEFSLECILAYIELMQFKSLIQSQQDQVVYADDGKLTPQSSIITRVDTGGSITCEETLQFELADNIPQSTIVYDENDDLETKAFKLYQKYIKVGSEFEINIASSIRAQLAQRFEPSIGFQRRISRNIQRRISNSITVKMDNMVKSNTDSNNNQAVNDLLTIFDDSSMEMVRLLQFSLSRFKTKPEWIKVQNFKTGK